MRVYAMVLPLSWGKRMGNIFREAGDFMVEFTPEIKSDIITADIEMNPQQYMVSSVLSATILAAALFFFAYVPLSIFDVAPGMDLILSFIPALIIAFLDFFILIRYPRILSVKRAEIIERDLIYALKEMILNISAGLSLFESIRRVSESDHGIVSKQLEGVVEDTNGGLPLDDALEKLALKTPSDYMRNALWQTVNAVKAGTSVKEALQGIIVALIREQNRKIRNYIQELNVMVMIYMLFAVAIPTIITTVLVVLTALMGTGVNEETYVLVVTLCLIVQVMLVGFIRSRRPLVYVT